MKFKKATTRLPLILGERQSTSQEETATAWYGYRLFTDTISPISCSATALTRSSQTSYK